MGHLLISVALRTTRSVRNLAATENMGIDRGIKPRNKKPPHHNIFEFAKSVILCDELWYADHWKHLAFVSP